MFPVDRLLLIGGVLLLLGIASSKFSARIGIPVLVLFLAVGMLAGSEGIGGIPFENYTLAHGIGTAALVLILFDGGLRTSVSAFRIAVGPALVLATAGVLLTAVITGLAAARLLDVPVLEGLLLGSIVGSTDAAAVFAILRSRGVRIRHRVAATLEIESGSNDPMAVFLTIGLLQALAGDIGLGAGLVRLFLVQMTVGALAGFVVGRATVHVVNRINLDAAGLYPVLTGAAALLSYGLAASLGGSGFLAVYLAGIIVGNSRIVFQRGVFRFHDGLAWLGQIGMFIVLGLLIFPSRVAAVAAEGILIATVLIFIARPIAVLALLAPFRFRVRELAFVSWVGLKGAVPIILATYPLMFGLPNGTLLFDIVFFVVVASAITQGWSLPLLARWLDLQRPAEAEPPVTLEITSLRDVEGDIVEYAVGTETRAAGRKLRELALPDGAVVALIARDGQLIPPRGSTGVLPGDHVFLVLKPGVRPLVDQVFSRRRRDREEVPELVEFPLRGTTTVGEIREFYGIDLAGEEDRTLDRVIRSRLRESPEPGMRIVVGSVALFVRELDGERIERVGLAILPSAEAEDAGAGDEGT